MLGSGRLTPERVREELKCKGIRIRDDWIQNWWDDAPLSSHVNIDGAMEAVTDAFLRSNLSQSAEGSVPLDVTLWHARRLTGVHIVEVKEAVNINEPHKTRHTLSGKSRCLKLALSDGRHLFPAIEYRRIDCLKEENLGCSAKLLLCAEPVVRRGVLLLQEPNVHILWKGYFKPSENAKAAVRRAVFDLNLPTSILVPLEMAVITECWFLLFFFAKMYFFKPASSFDYVTSSVFASQGAPRADAFRAKHETSCPPSLAPGPLQYLDKQKCPSKSAVSHTQGIQCLASAFTQDNLRVNTEAPRSTRGEVYIDKSNCGSFVPEVPPFVDLDDIADAVDVSAASCVNYSADKGEVESSIGWCPPVQSAFNENKGPLPRECFPPLLTEVLLATQKDTSAAANSVVVGSTAWMFCAVMKAFKYVKSDAQGADGRACWYLRLTDGVRMFSAIATTDVFSTPNFQGLNCKGTCPVKVLESLEGYFSLGICRDVHNNDTTRGRCAEVKAFMLHLPRDVALERLKQLCSALGNR